MTARSAPRPLLVDVANTADGDLIPVNGKTSGAGAGGDEAMIFDAEEDGSVDNDCHFWRKHAQVLHVSDFVVYQLEKEIKEFTVDEVGSMTDAWAGNGYLSVCGALFERNAHTFRVVF